MTSHYIRNGVGPPTGRARACRNIAKTKSRQSVCKSRSQHLGSQLIMLVITISSDAYVRDGVPPFHAAAHGHGHEPAV
eukprot:scaffold30424_cov27-Prasinocladus_malaysianus.AAC.8